MAKVFLRAYNREIETMIDRGQLDEAIAHCHHILKTFPKHLETYRLLGKAYLEGKRYGDAVDIFSRVIASVPNDFVSHVGLSIIRDEENKLDDAIWHMERAFETQPSNAAIQSELQRLYGRRDGVQPPRIRMTRGALAHMYVQGELYPQAISEIKSVLMEDPGRNDMQSLLARANFKSGAKNDAVDAALALLQRYPYALDANRVLSEVLSADRNENAQAYRQRVVELDPYAAQVSGSIFQSNEVADAAVSLERLDWNGQPVGMQSDWRESEAIGLEGGKSGDEQPDWLKGPIGETSPPAPSQSASAFTFYTPDSPQAGSAQPADDIPDFLKAAGWGESTGTFDESKSMFADDEPAAPVEPLAQGDLPDWVKAMKPAEPEPAAPEQEEELPDWINKIGTGALGSSEVQADWMNQPEETQQPFAAASDDQPDWLKGFDAPQGSAQPTSDQPDWLEGIGSESDLAPQPAQTDTPDWFTGLGSEAEAATTPSESDDDWIKQLGSQPAESVETPNDFDFLNELTQEPVLQTPEEPTQPTNKIDELGKSDQERDDSFAWLENLTAKQVASEGLLTTPEQRLEEEPEWVRQAKGLTGEPPAAHPPVNAEELGKSEQERDDSFAWLENLAAKQGASEGLLTRPEERLEQEPEWVKQARSLTSEQPAVAQPSAESDEPAKSEQERDDSFAWLEDVAAEEGASESLLTEPDDRVEQESDSVMQIQDFDSVPVEPPVSEPVSSIEEPGKSEQEQDDSFAWLEDLAAKQGASEDLMTNPEERLDEEPEWIEQAKSDSSEPPAVQPAANVEDLGKSEQERDDSFAWLENLAAKQGASEGLLTKPEERMEQEPEWVRQAKDLSVDQPVIPEPQDEPVEEQPVMEQPAPLDETEAWLKSLEEEEKQSEHIPAADETALWLQKLEQTEPAPEPGDADMPAWMKNIDQDESPAAETAVPAQEAEPSFVEPQPEESDVPSWLSDLEKEESSIAPANSDDLPAWLRDETGEVVAEPVKIEPTRPTDWKPVDSSEPEILYSPPIEEPKEPEIIYSPPLEETQAGPEPEMQLPPSAVEEPQETPAPPPPPEKPKPEPRPARKAPSRQAPPAEPVTRKGIGMLAMPGIDPMLGSARSELSRSNIPGALESYGRLIKKGRFLDEVIYDLREALYRYPVEVSIWQSLGDAYMRANRLQDALDAYTKAEELLR